MKLKTKLFIFLAFVTVSCLSLFLIVSLRLSIKDKLDFVKKNSIEEVLLLSQEVARLYQENAAGSQMVSSVLVDLFEKKQLASNYLIDKEGLIIAGPDQALHKNFSDTVSKLLLQKIDSTDFASGLVQIQDNFQQEIVGAFALVPETNLFTIQVYSVRELNRFLILFSIKILFLFFSIGSFFVFIGYYFVNRLTQGLDWISNSIGEFASGNYNYRILMNSQDEIGLIGNQLNFMAQKIQDSLVHQEEKVRLLQEVKTAQRVQETLFLKNEYRDGSISISGFYEPATECGGDWWYYFSTDDSVWVCAGDVTGHGVGSAMLTSSVRSAMSLIQRQKKLTPAEVLSTLNQVIFETVNSKMCMSFVVIQILKSENKIIYANAGHEAPIVIAKKQKVNRNQMIFLSESNGPLLGLSLEAVYSESELVLKYGERVLLYSDGVFDVANEKGELFKERIFHKSLLLANEKASAAKECLRLLVKDIQNWQGQQCLKDDLSFVCIDFDHLLKTN